MANLNQTSQTAQQSYLLDLPRPLQIHISNQLQDSAKAAYNYLRAAATGGKPANLMTAPTQSVHHSQMPIYNGVSTICKTLQNASNQAICLELHELWKLTTDPKNKHKPPKTPVQTNSNSNSTTITTNEANPLKLAKIIAEDFNTIFRNKGYDDNTIKSIYQEERTLKNLIQLIQTPFNQNQNQINYFDWLITQGCDKESIILIAHHLKIDDLVATINEINTLKTSENHAAFIAQFQGEQPEILSILNNMDEAAKFRSLLILRLGFFETLTKKGFINESILKACINKYTFDNLVDFIYDPHITKYFKNGFFTDKNEIIVNICTQPDLLIYLKKIIANKKFERLCNNGFTLYQILSLATPSSELHLNRIIALITNSKFQPHKKSFNAISIFNICKDTHFGRFTNLLNSDWLGIFLNYGFNMGHIKHVWDNNEIFLRFIAWFNNPDFTERMNVFTHDDVIAISIYPEYFNKLIEIFANGEFDRLRPENNVSGMKILTEALHTR